MPERRGAPRFRCRTRCRVAAGRKPLDATLLDVSRSGLSMLCDTEVSHGDPLVLHVAELEIRAIAWRIDRTRAGFRIGMMLEEVTPGYEALLTGLAKRSIAGARPPGSAVATPPRKPDPVSLDPWWRLRVKECDGPRTRVVTLAATSRAAAIERTTREIGAGWEILDVRPAKPVTR